MRSRAFSPSILVLLLTIQLSFAESPKGAVSAYAEKKVVIVAVGDYSKVKGNSLPTVKTDTTKFVEALKPLGYAQNEIVLLLLDGEKRSSDLPSTKEELIRRLKKEVLLKNDTGDPSSLLVMIAGHADDEGNLGLPFGDMLDRQLPLKEIVNHIQKSKFLHKAILLNCCYPGKIFTRFLPEGLSPSVPDTFPSLLAESIRGAAPKSVIASYPRSFMAPVFVGLTSGQFGPVPSEDEVDTRHSPFMKHFLAELQGRADSGLAGQAFTLTQVAHRTLSRMVRSQTENPPLYLPLSKDSTGDFYFFPKELVETQTEGELRRRVFAFVDEGISADSVDGLPYLVAAQEADVGGLLSPSRKSGHLRRVSMSIRNHPFPVQDLTANSKLRTINATISHSGKEAIITDEDSVRYWPIRPLSPRPSLTIAVTGFDKECRISPSGELLSVCVRTPEQSTLFIYNRNGKELFSRKLKGYRHTSFSSGGTSIVAGGLEGIDIVPIQRGMIKEPVTLGLSNTEVVHKIKVSSDGRNIAAVTSSGTIRVWELGLEKHNVIKEITLSPLPNSRPFRACAFRTDEKVLAILDASGAAHFYNMQRLEDGSLKNIVPSYNRLVASTQTTATDLIDISFSENSVGILALWNGSDVRVFHHTWERGADYVEIRYPPGRVRPYRSLFDSTICPTGRYVINLVGGSATLCDASSWLTPENSIKLHVTDRDASAYNECRHVGPDPSKFTPAKILFPEDKLLFPNGQVRIWDYAMDMKSSQILCNSSADKSFMPVGVSNDGQHIVSYSAELNKLHIERRADGSFVREILLNKAAKGVDFARLSNNRNSLITHDTSGSLLWNLLPKNGLEPVRLSALSIEPLRSIYLSENGKYAVLGWPMTNAEESFYDSPLRIWDTSSGKELDNLPACVPHLSPVLCPVEETVYYVSTDPQAGNRVNRYDLKSRKHLNSIAFLKSIQLVVLSNDGGKLSISTGDSWMLLNARTFERLMSYYLDKLGKAIPIGEMNRQAGPVSVLAFSKDGSAIAVGDHMGAVAIFDTRTGELVAPIFRLGSAISQIVFNDDGSAIAISDDLGNHSVWNLRELPFEPNLLSSFARAWSAKYLKHAFDDELSEATIEEVRGSKETIGRHLSSLKPSKARRLAWLEAVLSRSLVVKDQFLTNLLLADISEIDPKDIRHDFIVGCQAINSGRVADGMAIMKKITQAQPAFADAWSELGKCYLFSANQSDLASKAYERAIDQDNANPARYADLGDCQFAMGLYSEAFARFERALTLTDISKPYLRARWLQKMGECQAESGKYTEAAGYYQRSLDVREDLSTRERLLLAWLGASLAENSQQGKDRFESVRGTFLANTLKLDLIPFDQLGLLSWLFSISSSFHADLSSLGKLQFSRTIPPSPKTTREQIGWQRFCYQPLLSETRRAIVTKDSRILDQVLNLAPIIFQNEPLSRSMIAHLVIALTYKANGNDVASAKHLSCATFLYFSRLGMMSSMNLTPSLLPKLPNADRSSLEMLTWIDRLEFSILCKEIQATKSIKLNK